MKKYVYVGFAFPHHRKTHAGYHQIEAFVPYKYKVHLDSFYDRLYIPRSNKLFSRWWRKILLLLFGVDIIPLEIIKVIILGWFHKDLVIHLIYGENLYFPKLQSYIRSGNKIVSTFHQPYDWFEKNKWFLSSIKQNDGIILVSDNEKNSFQTLSNSCPVKYIPHGISTSFYCINFSIKKENLLLTVGNWLRDYEFANKVYTRLLNEDETLQICVVSSVSNKKYLSNHPRLHFLSGISDDALRSLYCRCNVLFLPLIRYTANNSLLEASSTGCNIVISSNNNDNCYIPKHLISFSKMDIDETISTIKRTRSYQYNIKLSKYIEEHYSWNVIGKETESFFEGI